jgi:excinuclease UvrABC nuclease subunit
LFLGNKDDVLYIGVSINGIGRPSSKSHHAKLARLECNRVLVYPCLTRQMAHKLEIFLIAKLMPKYNKRLPLKSLNSNGSTSN